MTDVKRLLDEATPLPWRVFDGGEVAHPGIDGDNSTIVVYGTADEDYGVNRPEDAALIVYAVNALPDYEAAVDALVAARRWDYDDGPCWCDVGPNGNFPNHLDRCQNARAALRRLRGDE